MNTETRGTLSRRGNISQITNAFVEEVNAFSNTSTGYIIVSYAASPGQQSDNIQMLRLNINRNTVILDSSGQVISLSEIRPQTWINAVFSSAMTRSIPPQANAFLIMVQKRRLKLKLQHRSAGLQVSTPQMAFCTPAIQTTSTARSATSSQIPPSPIHPAARSHFHPSAPASASALHMQPHRPQASHLRQ